MKPLTADMEIIRALIRNRDDFVITGHQNPDGDAVGACFGLALALEKLQKRVQVVLEPYASKFNIIPGGHLRYAGPLDELNVGVLFCLDCGDAQRLGAARVLIERTTDTVCVDHHITNTGFARYNYLDGEASSASELVFRLIHTEVEINRDIASAIYAGLVNDTGGFRYSATSRDTLDIAGQLMALGIPFTDIYTELSHQHTFTEAKLFGRALDVCARCLDDRVVYSCVTREMMADLGATGQDLDGVVEYLLNVRGAEAAVLLYDKSAAEVKISLRSRGIDVGLVALSFGGGGHKLAAGANLTGDIQEIKDRVLKRIEQELNNHA